MADEETQEKSSGKEEKAPARLATAVSTGGGHAVIVAQPAPPVSFAPSLPKVSRRSVIIWGWWGAFLAMLAGIGAATVNFLWSRTAQRLSGSFTLDFKADEMQPGEKRAVVVLVPNKQNPLQNLEAKIFLVRLNDEQARLNHDGERSGAFLALSRKCPHLGCTVPYAPNFSFLDPDNNNESVTGWFRCPCHGSTYSDSGRRVFGPAPRSMDVYALTIAEDGTMTVDVGTKFEGSQDNIKRAVKPGEKPA